MSRLNDSNAKKILIDRTDFKLSIAKNLLEKIGGIPYSEGVKDFQLEFYSECFLIFSNGVIEILADEINEKFQIFQRKNYQMKYMSYEQNLTDDETRMISTMNKGGRTDKFLPSFNIYKLRDKLDTTKSDQKIIFDLIMKYFDYPKPTLQSWDFNNSSLWQLRELRNHVAHQRALNRNYVIGSREDVQYIFRFEPIDTINFQLVRVVKNPQNFFKELFDDLVTFRNEIRNIIPYNMSSSEYKNQLDFGLQF